MLRTVIQIDEEKCNGCQACVSGCHEGAIQMVEGKARMISDLYCDGLGACIGECPVDAITFIEREAEPYDEIAVMKRLIPKGEATIIAHLKHLKEHNELEYLRIGRMYLKEQNIEIDLSSIHSATSKSFSTLQKKPQVSSGCPGAQNLSFGKPQASPASPASPAFQPAFQQQGETVGTESQLRQWPVQLHLLNPGASFFKNADVVLAADCAAFAYGDFHNRFLKGKVLAIACPKLDSNKDVYVNKLVSMINEAHINTLTTVIMEVPCCNGLLQLAQKALAVASRRIPLKVVVIGIQGKVLKEEWL